jgi:hypothetical protein
VRFVTKTPEFERAKTVHALDGAATVISFKVAYSVIVEVARYYIKNKTSFFNEHTFYLKRGWWEKKYMVLPPLSK